MPASIRPFPGLRPFRQDEAHLFFGRSAQISELLRRLRRTRFVVVVGTSGSGKSSLVRAGLLPALADGYRGKAGARWRIAVFRPGSEPITRLAEALASPSVYGPGTDGHEAGDPVRVSQYEATLRRGGLGLLELVQQARRPVDENLLVVVDQFEELFPVSEDGRAFVTLVLEATRQVGMPIYVVFTMRSDYLGACAQFRGLPEAINDSQFLVSRLTRTQRREAIEGPVAVARANISNRLVQRLLNDVGDNPDHLPLLQHALMRTWDQWIETNDPALDLPHYEHPSVGTIERALNIHAETALDGLDVHARRHTEMIFRAITDTDPDGRRVRRRVPLSQLMAVTGAGREEILAIVSRFQEEGRSFLFWSADPEHDEDPELDLSHESLIRQWETLDGWVTAEAAARDDYLRLARRATREDLLAGDALKHALTWRNREALTPAWAVRYHPEHDSEEAGAVLTATLEFIDRCKRAQDRRRLFTLLSVLILVGLTAIALIARQAAVAAREETDVAYERVDSLRLEALRIAADEQRARLEADTMAELREAEAERAGAAERAARDSALAARTARAAALQQADSARAARDAAQAAQERAELARDDAETAESLAVIARNTALSERRKTISLSLAAQARRVQEQEANPSLGALLARQAFEFDSTGAFRDVIYDALGRNLEALRSGTVDTLLLTLDNVVYSAMYGPGGLLAVATEDGAAIVAQSGPIGSTPAVSHPDVRTLAFSPDGSVLVTGGVDGVRTWNLTPPEMRGGSALLPADGVPEPEGPVRTVAFHPGGDVFAAAGDAGVVIRAVDGEVRTRLPIPGVRAVAFSPDGEVLAAGSEDGTLSIWPWPTLDGDPSTVVLTTEIRALAFSPGGDTLAAAGGADGDIYLIDVHAPDQEVNRLVTLEGHRGPVGALDFDSSGRRLASGSADRTARVWPLDGGNPLLIIGHTDEVRSVSFLDVPGRLTLVTGSFDRTVRRWNLDIEDLAERVCGLVGRGLDETEWTTYVGSDFPYTPACDEDPRTENDP